MPKSASANSVRRKTLALDAARGGVMGGGLALLFVVWLYTANNVIYNVTFMGGDSSQTLLTVILAFVAEFGVGAAMSVVVFRMLKRK